MPEIVKLMEDINVDTVVEHMCRFGMESKDDQGTGLVKKPTGWATNSPCTAEQVAAQWKHMVHRHARLINGRAQAAQVYPMKLCLAILRGLKNQLISNGRMNIKDIGIVTCEVIDGATRQQAWDEVQSRYPSSAEVYHDDIAGDLLGTDFAVEAIREDMDTYHKHVVYCKVNFNRS